MHEQNLWAPWRMSYLRELVRRQQAAGGSDDDASDFLARYWATPDDDVRNHVLARDEHGMILLNRYPYANGHLLVALGAARPTLHDYDADQRAAFWRLVDRAVALAERTLNPQGVNVGINQGSAAGAGVPEHLHAHVVPRWSGDTNFITVIGDVRVVPSALEDVAAAFRDVLRTDGA